jgi:hypothetical protein
MHRRLLICVVAFLASAAPAVAQDPVQDAYGGSGVQGVTVDPSTGSGTPDEGNPPAADEATGDDTTPGSPTRSATPSQAVTPAPGQQLPFTGFDIALLVLGGGVLLALGFGLRRASRDIAP